MTSRPTKGQRAETEPSRGNVLTCRTAPGRPGAPQEGEWGPPLQQSCC